MKTHPDDLQLLGRAVEAVASLAVSGTYVHMYSYTIVMLSRK